jgi:hypothetical protein
MPCLNGEISSATHQTVPASVAPTAVLQRACACGKHAAGGTCDQCRKKGEGLQRAARTVDAPAVASDSVHDALGRSGQPLPSDTRALMESRFGQDFSAVRVHTDASAHRSADAVNALAYTVGPHIAFGAGQYSPSTGSGQQLLAHELTHVVQQRGIDPEVQPSSLNGSALQDERMEHEAGHAAEEVVAGRHAPVAGSARTAALQRQDKDKKSQPQAPKIVPPAEPSKAQKKMIDQARSAAAVRTQAAMFKARGVQGAVDFQDARRLAQIKFDWADPNMDQVSEVLSGMGGGLITVDVKVAGAGDPDCGARAGYVRDHRPPIVLCPGFFSDPGNDEGRIRTMIHEMAHVKGVGKADVGEQYFPVFDCTSKGAFESADSWANYVHCLSGRTPDKPDEIVVPRGGGKAGNQAPKKQGGSE